MRANLSQKIAVNNEISVFVFVEANNLNYPSARRNVVIMTNKMTCCSVVFYCLYGIIRTIACTLIATRMSEHPHEKMGISVRFMHKTYIFREISLIK